MIPRVSRTVMRAVTVLVLIVAGCGGSDRSLPAAEVARQIQNYLVTFYENPANGIQVECAEGENDYSRSRPRGGEGYVCTFTDSSGGEWSGEAEVNCRLYEPGPEGNDATCGFFVASAFDGHGATGGFSFDAP